MEGLQPPPTDRTNLLLLLELTGKAEILRAILKLVVVLRETMNQLGYRSRDLEKEVDCDDIERKEF